MTKKHFIELADVLRKPGMMHASIEQAVITAKRTGANDDSMVDAVMAAVVTELADYCKSQAVQFNRKRWLNYVAGTHGPNGGKL